MIEFEVQLPKECRGSGDNWRGLASAEERRKIQNRLHQRSWRKRAKIAKLVAGQPEQINPGFCGESGREFFWPGEKDRSLSLDSSGTVARLHAAAPSLAGPNVKARSLSSRTLFTLEPDHLLVLQPLLSSLKLRGVWSYGVNVLWPGSSSRPPNHHDPQSWTWTLFRHSTASPLLFHALSYTMSAGVDLYRTHSKEHETLGLQHQTTAIHLLKQTLETQHGSAGLADDVILAIGLLMQGRELPDFEAANRTGKLYGAFRPLLQHLQWLSCVGGTQKIRVHRAMVRSAVDAKGGLAEISMPHMAEWLQYHDIADASHNITRPYFDLCPFYRQHLSDNLPRRRLSHQARTCVAFAFDALGLDLQFVDLLWDMRAYIELTESYCAGASNGGVDPPQLAVHRNLIQYRLLAMTQTTSGGAGIDELVWLGALIFSYTVIYPLPDRRPLDTLLGRLKGALISVGTLAVKRELLLWLNLVGAMAAEGRVGESWFAANLAEVSGRIGLRHWVDVKGAVGGYLWSEQAGEVGGERVWRVTMGISPA